MAQTRLYFAYGEGMNVNRLKKYLSQRGGRPDGVVSAQRAVLSGYELVFNVRREIPWQAGIANLKENPKAKVEGVLMEIDNTTEGHVQKKEGIPASSKRIEVSVVGDKEKTYDNVSVYVALEPDEKKAHAPTKAYMKLMIEAATDFEFSKGYVEKLKKVKTSD